MSKILDFTIGVILLGTPHRGTDNITSSELLQRIIRAGTAGEASSLIALEANNEMVLDAVQGFSIVAHEKNIPVHCFFEQKSSKVSKMFGDDYKDFIVDEESAILDGFERYGLPLDHYQLNKFSDPKDGNWRELSDVITNLCDNAQQELANRKSGNGNRNGYENNSRDEGASFSGHFSTNGGKQFIGGNFNSGGGSITF
ncbi:hypothetical protein sscle_14g100360 [Sclerotinia sclerotiorum 1980 UF-70]|uniref:Uncharacterized protein n=1 Tax=Sclerotinia sclerotiorum (strain ATCC 18683 / 1980 / Ss-1) TaxID=665079 RepID=A0A1D9QK04_SCLS1|nr:hypothetical protein sscle_14g100360 [Sclerotinia sclerotiorum 1980 UF-70]